MASDPTSSYQQASARGATPIGQIVVLYDTILRDFGRALVALKTGNIEARVFELNHAVLVIGHLQGVLNFERGGEAAKIFERFYTTTRAMIVQANIRATPESLEELIDLYGGLRQAWYQAGQKPPANLTQTPTIERSGDPPRTPGPIPANDDVETPQLQWSA